MHMPSSSARVRAHQVRHADHVRQPGPPERGWPYPLGAHWNGAGTNFSVFSEVATGIDLCLFDSGEERRIAIRERSNYCWHVFMPGIGPGQRYGFRAHGPWDPASGRRCNPAKLLLDPYARAIDGVVNWGLDVLPHQPDTDGMVLSDTDSAPVVPRSLVVDTSFDWEGDQPLGRPLADTIVYELHVRGFSASNPAIPEELRGTYAGLGHPASIEYLQSLGITAVELLPVHHFLDEAHVLDRGLKNYWGYNSIGFFAPHAAYAVGGDAARAVDEFKGMVKALHAAGIEVLLDVVYNHTAEGNHLGAMLSFKGFDNAAYYRLVPDSPQHYMDFSGVGNTLNLRHPQTTRLVMDSLRYWVTEMHVDGFRFDLAVALARGERDFDSWSPFLTAAGQDPVLATTKLIAEPWDVSDGGYQVGRFPAGWSEWNGRYRDVVRDYWRSQPGTLGEFATRLTGSADLYKDNGRAPTASINFVTVHDGFTLRDLVSYNDKHNEANAEDNRDGTNDNRSWNLGAEGPTDDAGIEAARARQSRNFLATVLLSHGVPMILSGDEIGHTQQGNNNAYCQDNDISWMNWTRADEGLLAFTRRVIGLRRTHAAFRRRTWAAPRGSRRRLTDLAWFSPGGDEMTDAHWNDTELRALMLLVDGAVSRKKPDARERFLLVFNAALDAVTFTLPSPRWGDAWSAVLDTAELHADAAADQAFPAGSGIERSALSLVVLQAQPRAARKSPTS